jgi:hypothetical protein
MIIVTQNTNTSITVFIELAAGGAATGLLFSAVTAQLKKEGEASFSAFTLSGSNFTDLSNGFYEIDLTSTNTNTLGNLYLSLTGPTIKTQLVTVYVAVSGSITPSPAVPSTSTTNVYGYIKDLTGTSVLGASVSAKILSMPAFVPSGSVNVGVTTSLISTKTDSSGYFSLTLLEGMAVDVTISSLNYRRTIVVPASDSDLFSIL